MNNDSMIKITLPIGRWNVIFNMMNRLTLAEIKEIANDIRPQLEGKTFENDNTMLEVELSIGKINLLLSLIKMLPFYDSYDIVTAVMAQGTAQIQAATEASATEASAAEAAPAAEDPVKKSRKRKAKKDEEA